jgi:hypothetical protein
VLIATPDHWHAVQTVHACQTGKHVYVEKPASVTIEEGRAMVDAARRTIGPCRSARRRARRKGRGTPAGRSATGSSAGSPVTCWHYANPVDDKPVPDSAPPEGLDWDLWLGPLPLAALQPATHPGVFRWVLESGGGQIRDRGAHQFSTILWCMNADRQTSFTVEAKGRAPNAGSGIARSRWKWFTQFKNPDWTLGLGPAGRQGRQDRVRQRVLGRTRPVDSRVGRAVIGPPTRRRSTSRCRPAAYEVERTDEYEDFNMNHKADWFRPSAKATPAGRGHRDRPSHRRALHPRATSPTSWAAKLIWDGENERVVGDEQANRAEKPKGKYVVLTREAAIKGGREGAAVIPGKSAESPMIHYVADLVLDMEMPPKDMRDQFPALAKDQVALLRAWIDQGAK